MSRIYLSQVLKNLHEDIYQKIYQDSNLIRYTCFETVENDIHVGWVIDSFIKYGIISLNLSVKRPTGEKTALVLDFPCESISQTNGLVFSSDDRLLVWTPDEYKNIVHDQENHIVSLTRNRLTFKNDREGVMVDLSGSSGTINLPLFIFTRNPNAYKEQILTISVPEKHPVIQANWFRCSGLSSIWTFLADCKFYNTSGKYIFESQQIPHALYFYYIYMFFQTDKDVYLFLKEYVAYETLLSVAEGDIWTHGCWQHDDIHFVNWIAGVNIFLSHYEDTRQPIFLETSRKILDASISLADRCSGNAPWFLHDSFEIPNRHEKTYYQNVFESNAFGKSKENTLALNTHVWTLLALYKFNRLSPEERYAKAYHEGMDLLQKVLDSRPASALFALAYGVRDFFLNVLVYKKKIFLPSIIRVCDEFLRRRILPKLKKRYPRLYMPTGFIERDLTFSFLDQFYHLLNIERLLALYVQNPSEKLLPCIKQSLDYSINSKMALYFTHTNIMSQEFLGVLLLYGTHIDPSYLRHLQDFTLLLLQKYHALPIKSVAFPYISDIYSTLRTENPAIVILVADARLKITGIVLNTSSEEQHFRLEWKTSKRYCLEDWEGNRISASDGPVAIPGFSSLKIVTKS